MIDLSYKPKKKKDNDKITIFHIIGTGLLIFLFWLIFTEGFIHGIY